MERGQQSPSARRALQERKAGSKTIRLGIIYEIVPLSITLMA